MIPSYFENPTSLNEEKRENLLKKTYINIGNESIENIRLESNEVLKFGREFFSLSLVREKLCPKFKWFRTAAEVDPVMNGICRICWGEDQT